jgi:transposase
MTIIRQRLSDDVFHKVFLFVLQQLKAKKLLKGKTIGVDATTLEANAAMRSIVCKETGEDWKEYLRQLGKEEGIENPSDEDIQRLDRGRKGKCSVRGLSVWINRNRTNTHFAKIGEELEVTKASG